MAPQKTPPEGDVPVRQVNNILQTLRLVFLRYLGISRRTLHPQGRALQTRTERAGQARI